MFQDYTEKIQRYVTSDSRLRHATLGVLLTADTLYEDLPGDLSLFRQIYSNLDPAASDMADRGITFLRMAASKEAASAIKRRLNTDLNVKFNDIAHSKNYRKNMVTFKRYSIEASRILDDILKRGAFPLEIVEVLRERVESRMCHDYYRMLMLYRQTRDRRLRFELLRKLGLILLIARINRYIELEPLNNSLRNVRKAIIKGLGLRGKAARVYYFSLHRDGRLIVRKEDTRSADAHRKGGEKRTTHGRDSPAVQREICHPCRTSSGTEIIRFEIRNKLRNNGAVSYTSYVEKMVRKNLEFPNQVYDTIGVKIVIKSEHDIPKIVAELESFLGGSLSRKREKDVYRWLRTGRAATEQAATDYYVWKAVYDIPLPHPSIPMVKRMIRLTKGNTHVQQELKRTLSYYLNNPLDFVIEVQLQDIHSYLMSKAKGSPTAHARLKAKQIRSNSFYKLFPKEIYEKDVAELKHTILNCEPQRSRVVWVV